MWHCPHCGAPQAETARCWVCRRSSTTCSTCRHFRTALAGDLGYCALDRARRPLTGRELRGCWEERPESTVPEPPPRPETHRLRVGTAAPPQRPPGSWDNAPGRQFVALDLVGRLPAAPEVAGSPESASLPSDPVPALLPEVEDWADQTSLFGDGER